MRLRFATRARRGGGAGSAPEGEPTTRAVQAGGPTEPETDATNGRDAAHEPTADIVLELRPLLERYVGANVVPLRPVH